MMRRALMLVALLAGPAAADDLWLNAGAKGTVGTEKYFGTDWFAQVGSGDFSVKPMFSEYSSDVTTGTYKTFSARGAYDTQLFGLGVTVGGTPKVDGYSNTFAGADATLSLTPGSGGPVKRINGAGGSGGPARGEGLARVDIGGAIKHTNNRDEFQAATAVDVGRRGARIARRAAAITIGQNDLTGTLGVSLMDVLLSADVTKTVYDRDLAAINARASQAVRLSGVASTIQGFPDTSTDLHLELGQLPFLTPYISYVHTRYKIAQPDSNAVTAGVYVELGILELEVSGEHLAQAGQVDRNYGSVGGTVRF